MLKVLLESQGHNGVDGVAYHPKPVWSMAVEHSIFMRK